MALVPNFGRNISAREPVGVDHIYQDTHAIKEVFLAVFARDGNVPADWHWAIVWKVGVSSRNDAVYRMCQIVRERGSRGLEPHLTNWGPKTHISGETFARYGRFYSLGHVSYTGRQSIEQLAAREPILVPDGIWNCQSWVKSVIWRCVHASVFDAANASRAIEGATQA